MAMATATTALLSSPLLKSPAPPLRTQPHHSPTPLRLRLQPRRRVTTASLSSARGDPREAEAAVAELLRDHGASPADAAAIAARAPGYAAMLADGVRELDELGLWASWSAGAEMGALGFGRKVYFMGRSRRDGGVVPLVESLGVRLSSAKLIAPYVAAEGLPVLIHRMEARSGGLSMLAQGDVSFPYLIESFPMLLLCSEDNHLKPLIDYLECIGIPKPRISSVLLSFPPIILSDIENDIKPRIYAWEKAGIEQEYIGKMLLKYPWILSTSVIENYGQMLLFFKRKQISSTVLGVAVKSWPHILGCSTKRINSILVLFDDLGISKKMLVPVLTSSPQLLLRKTNEILQIVTFFEDMGLDKNAVAKIICRSPEIIASDVDNTLKKKIDFLIDFGVSERNLPRIIRKYPELLLLDIDRTLLPRMNYFLGMGLSKKDVCSMISRFSPLLGYSVDLVMKPKLEFLLRTMKKPLKAIVEYPRYFSYSLEGKIKPRFWVIKGRNIDCSLTDMFAKNDEAFAEEYLGIETLPETLQSSKGG
nr:transcription termination factor MTERF6, chloroplastic/mitochondrial isoform X2 [Lolium perenne]